MRTTITRFLIAIILMSSISCRKESIPEDGSISLDEVILRGNTGGFKIRANGHDYHFYVDYQYRVTPTVNRESFDVSIYSTNSTGIEALFNSSSLPNLGIDTIGRGAIIDELTFPRPTIGYGSSVLFAGREIGKTNFDYVPVYKAQFYKFYYYPVKFPTRDKNVQEGPPMYGYMLVYFNPDKVIIAGMAWSVRGSIKVPRF